MSQQRLKHLVLFITSVVISIESYSQKLSPSQINYIEETLVDLNSEPGDILDFSAIIQAVGDKKIILLGEFNHGTEEVFFSRNELIRQINEALGVDLILFDIQYY